MTRPKIIGVNNEPSQENGYLLGKVKSRPFFLGQEQCLGNELCLARRIYWKFIPESKLQGRSVNPRQLTISSLNSSLTYEDTKRLYQERALEDRLTPQIREIEKKLQEAVKQAFFQVEPFEFEEYVADLLAANGWKDVLLTSKSHDEGVDILGKVPILQGTFRNALVEVKRKKKVGRKEVEEIIAKLEKFLDESDDLSLCYVICAGDVTPEAQEVFQEWYYPLIVIDGDDLAWAAIAVDLVPNKTWPPKNLSYDD